jgi:branched-chain amino acid transport system permease protein
VSLTGEASRPAATGRRALWLLPLAACLVPLAANQYLQYVVNLILVYVLVGVGFNIVVGNLGQLAFANAAFFGLGAYGTGIVMVHLGVPFAAAIWAGAVLGACAGALASVPALRGIRMFYLAIITLAFGELLRWGYIRADKLTAGSMGMTVPPGTFFGLPLASEFVKFYLFLALVTLAVAGTSNLLRSRFGRAFQAIRDNELAAASLGVPTARYIVLAFAWSGFVVGLGGGMFALLVGHVTPESFNLVQLILHFAIVIVGGIGSLAGSVIGAVVLTSAPELFRDFPGFEELFFAVLIILVLMVLPKGLASLLARKVPLFRERYWRE